MTAKNMHGHTIEKARKSYVKELLIVSKAYKN